MANVRAVLTSLRKNGAKLTDVAQNLDIGGVKISGRAFLAPMAGITDGPFRAIAERYGAGLVVCEMIASAALGTGQAEMVRKLKRTGSLPHVVQLAGCEGQWMARGAKIAADAGADIIDINLGCPSKRVTNGYAGSALMRVPDKALKIIESVVKATAVPVTVKMRLGWDDSSLNAAQISRMAEDAGVKMISVHGRTRQQFYKGDARWAPVREVVDAVQVPVIVNGDIVDLGSAQQALRLSGASGVMIGRGAQGQPWMVGQINSALAGAKPDPAPQNEALLDLIEGHRADMFEAYGAELGVRVARKHLGWYLDRSGIGLSKQDRKALMVETDSARISDKLTQIFSGELSEAA